MSSVRSPRLSTHHNRDRASSRVSPATVIASVNWSAMPMPAVPAPKITTRWSPRVSPVTRKAPRIAARFTAPVPCTSSLNVRIRFRYRARMRLALAGPKSSQCSIAWGNNLVAATT